ncbi:hypothetical protein B0H67DRAFT_135195 [Lasiosphaeris hirsuta]|uniref:Uncharacterized protein n=1 Tax=Lasiosphaeris hirsuta TaxID=260670 RepID=A0AA40E7R9_9PEZI|nr:hypothetical protein B0H67DRAFT_135195 [Lasiosphaeris hirsuta]
MSVCGWASFACSALRFSRLILASLIIGHTDINPMQDMNCNMCRSATGSRGPLTTPEGRESPTCNVIGYLLDRPKGPERWIWFITQWCTTYTTLGGSSVLSILHRAPTEFGTDAPAAQLLKVPHRPPKPHPKDIRRVFASSADTPASATCPLSRHAGGRGAWEGGSNFFFFFPLLAIPLSLLSLAWSGT